MRLLDGVTVVENAQAGTGPFAASTLGDMGAEVIKIERPETGDTQRHLGKDVGHTMGDFGAFFVSLNRNKKYVSANLKSESGRQVYRDIVADADILIENFRPGKMDELGIGYDDLVTINDELIYCSISGFGSESRYRDMKASDLIIQAFSGAMSMTGEQDRSPVRTQVPIADISGSMYTVQAALAALYARDFNDEGSQLIEIPMDGSLISWVWWRAWYSQITGEPHPRGNRHPQVAPCNAFETRDSHIMVLTINEESWQQFCKAIDREDLAEDPRFENNDKRLENIDELERQIGEVMKKRPTSEWFELLREHDVSVSPVYDTVDLWDDPHVQESGLKQRVPLEDSDDDLHMVRFPATFDGEQLPIRRPTGALGADNEPVLASLGYSEAEIERLKEEGSI